MPQTVMDKQAKRQSEFPEDRIAFLKGSKQAADADKMVLIDWHEHGSWRKGESYKRAVRQATEQIAKNNYLDEVTVEQFDRLLQITGFRRIEWEKMR